MIVKNLNKSPVFMQNYYDLNNENNNSNGAITMTITKTFDVGTDLGTVDAIKIDLKILT